MTYEKAAFLPAFASHLFLSELYLSFYPSFVPVHAYVFGICHSGNQEAWTVQGTLLGYTPSAPLPSVGRLGIRPCTLTFTLFYLYTMWFDVHTHQLSACPSEAIFNCEGSYIPMPGEAAFLSVGIHPWYLSKENYSHRLHEVEALIKHDKRVVAVGEAGLDKYAEAPFALQEEAFRAMCFLAEQYRLPLIIHSVKTYNELMALKKALHPSQPWIIHGFRGKKELAQSLVRQGFYLSFGEHYHPDALAVLPEDTFLLETDESCVPIEELYRRAASIRGRELMPFAVRMEQLVNSLFFNR